MPKSTKSKKKTDQKAGYEVNKVKRLVLYIIGKNRVPLSAYDIEKEMIKQIIGPDRQKYVYNVLNRLVPHEQELPHTLLFQLNDFFDAENCVKGFDNDEKKDKMLKRVVRNVFKSYWILLGGKEEDWECSMPVRKKTVFVIGIKRKNDHNNILRFIFQEGDNSNQLLTELFYNNEKIPLLPMRAKGTTKIYSVELFPYLHLKHYLDLVSKRSSSEVELSNELTSRFEVHQIITQDSPVEDFQCVLNLRGLLRYILLNKLKTETQYGQINEVIEILSQVDIYQDLEEEFKALDPIRKGLTLGNRIYLEKKDSNYKIKKRFPFLSYYNEYKECLPNNFAVDILYEIATDLRDKLEEKNIFDLKYEVTQRFLERLERFFWAFDNIFPAEPVFASMNSNSKTIRSVYRNYQHEIRTYIKARKEKEIKIQEKRERNIREELEILDFKQMILEYIENEHKDIISISEINCSTETRMTHYCLTGTQINIIKNICEFERHDYQFGWHHLFKRALIEEIDKLLAPEMDYESAKRILMEKGIDEGVLTEILNLSNYNINFDKKMQIYRIVRKHIPKLNFEI